jgi:cell division septal protein FtsQ
VKRGGIGPGRPGGPRHELANRARGSRARAHLARARERERRRLAQRERQRARARHRGPADPRTRVDRRLVFALAGLGGLALAAVAGESAWTRLAPEFAAIETIAIQGHRRLESLEIADATGVGRGTPLGAVDPVAVRDRLLGHSWIREATVLRLPPSTLLVRVREREPRAVLSARAEGTPDRLVDAEGTPFESDRIPADLPRLVGGDTLPSGAPDSELAAALELMAGLDAAGAARLAGDDGRLALHLPDGDAPEGWVLRGATEVVLGRRTDASQLDRLERLLASPEWRRGEGGGAARIDLRFADQAVLSGARGSERG